ncbi:MAG: hypothetical protein ACRDD1_07495, partial [Planctomycetia bacterium]
ILLKVDGAGRIAEQPLDKIAHAKVELANAPAADAKDRRGGSLRAESITDLAFIKGNVVVAGLSNEEFASKLRTIAFPFTAEADQGSSVEIYHGAHGAFETRSPVRTFVPFTIDGEPHLLAAYTCTPLVKFPVSRLKAGEKVRGATVAELGNRNRPLDMIVYKKGGKDFLLLANNARGVMKIPADAIAGQEGIEAPVKGTAGVGYETIEGLKGVEQLDGWNDDLALVLTRTEAGGLALATIPLP